LKDDDDIFRLGFVNSLFAVRLVGFIESRFNIIVDPEELELSNFNTIENIDRFVMSKL
jgi:acyl carrier protein